MQIGQSIKSVGALGIDVDDRIVFSLFFVAEQTANNKEQYTIMCFES